jgi:glycine hydroxymethyltransferase
MAKIFKYSRYKTEIPSGKIDLTKVRQVALETKPKLIICGHSSYPREYDYAGFRQIADEVGALLMADVSHLGGLIAGGVLKNPLDFGFDVMTTTTHKSLRGPRGGIILCKKAHGAAIDKSVFPGMQGGPHMHQIAAIATTMKLVATDSFRNYAKQVLVNAQALAQALLAGGAHLITGGTENHLLVINTATGFGITGDIAEKALDKAGITLNKNVIPDDPNPPMKPSGIRFGTPAATARGMGEPEMKKLADIMLQTLRAPGDDALLAKLRGETKAICARFPVPGLTSDKPKACSAAA